MIRALPLLLLVVALPSLAQDHFYLKEPKLGSLIPRNAEVWKLPLDKSYAQLTDEQKAIVRNRYVDMPAEDEPPFPANGLIGIAKGFEEVREARTPHVSGRFYAAVRIDETGKARGIEIFETPDEKYNAALTAVLLRIPYTPGTCSGKPCVMDFPIARTFKVHPRSHFG